MTLCRTNWSAGFVITICVRMPCAQPCCIELPCLIKVVLVIQVRVIPETQRRLFAGPARFFSGGEHPLSNASAAQGYQRRRKGASLYLSGQDL